MKTKMKLIGMAGTLVFLVGCASNAEYYAAIQHANEQNAQIEIARAQAESERMKALQSIAFSGDETAQTAAIMGLTFAGQQSGGSGGQGTGSVAPRQPESTGDTVLRWASVLLPSLTNLYAIDRSTAVQRDQISANRDVSINTNETMLGFGHLAAGKDAPIIGGNDERLIFPVNPDSVVVGGPDDVVLNPAPED